MVLSTNAAAPTLDLTGMYKRNDGSVLESHRRIDKFISGKHGRIWILGSVPCNSARTRLIHQCWSMHLVVANSSINDANTIGRQSIGRIVSSRSNNECACGDVRNID